MIGWRLCRPEFAAVLDGEGNRKTGSRWNSSGHGVVYASEALALCVLEAFVHLPLPMRRHLPEMAAVCIDIPDDVDVERIDRVAFNELVADSDAELKCRHRGDRWLSDNKALVLVAPSIIVPQDWNLMLNPAHRRMAEVKIRSIEQFTFDTRLSGQAAAAPSQVTKP
jgi:RES domain-containing protein